MRNLVVMMCVIVAITFGNAQKPVRQTIKFANEGAREVFMVWGVNDWQPLAQEKLPYRSYIKDGLIYTLLKQEQEGMFSINLHLDPGTKIDYVFWITKGPLGIPCDIWDLNGEPKKDYHTTVFNNNTVQVDSNVIVKPKQQPSVLNFSGRILLVLVLLFSIFLIVKRVFLKGHSIKPGPIKMIAGGSGIVLLLLFLTRASVSSLGWDLYYHPVDNFSKFLWAGFYDHLFVVVMSIFFISLLLVFRNFKRVRQVVLVAFLLTSLSCVIASILNIRVVEMIGKPFNFRWLYYSGFLNSSDSKAAVSENISTEYIVDVTAICLAAIVAGILVIYALEFFFQRYKLKKVALLVFVCLNTGYFFMANSSIEKEKWNYDRLANPIAAFLSSVNPFVGQPELYTSEVPDSLKFSKINYDTTGTGMNYSGKIKNVVLVVLESTPAEYLQPYAKNYQLTPELEKQIPNSIVFNNVYAHAPATNKSMVCLLGSVYPWLSYASITQEYPNISMPTLSSELNAHGYRTAFFNSGDNDFQKAGEFLSFRQFEEIKDCKSLDCEKKFIEQHSKEPLDGLNDECAAQAMLSWIGKDRGKPFFTMMWTYQTHYPYYPGDSVINYTDRDPILNRYLNAVKHSDKVLGMILADLKQKKLDKSTLVVVMGDHGEAFGSHGQTTHASKIYEENLHIPLIFINPSFTRKEQPQIGGVVDISPTIMGVLGLSIPEKWQGQNLFASKNDRTYFFCPWSDYLFGFREGDKKYIYNATTNVTEVYDLKSDPQETCDLSKNEDLELCHLKLAAWVQYQDRYMKELFKQPAAFAISSHKKER